MSKEAAFEAYDLATRLGVPAGTDIVELRELVEERDRLRRELAESRGTDE